MIIVVCLDDSGGMMFNRRRQSQDRVLRARVLALSAGERLRMSPYSAGQFAEEDAPQIAADDDFLDKAAPGDYCFVEDADILPYLDQIEQVIVYHWNRSYPADTYFAPDLSAPRWALLRSSDFAGFSHEKITEEVYRAQ